MTTKAKKLDDDTDLAAAIKRKVHDLANLMDLARLRNLDVAFQIQKDVVGKYKVTSLSITRTTKL